MLPSPNFTVIYTTTPVSTERQRLVPEFKAYEMDYSSLFSAHMDLKRDVSAFPHATSNSSMVSNAPLFEKYQFFTPGKDYNAYIIIKMLMRYSYIHGSFCGPNTCIDSVCRHIRCSKPASNLRGIRQGDGSGSAEEAAAIGTKRFLREHLHL